MSLTKISLIIAVVLGVILCFTTVEFFCLLHYTFGYYCKFDKNFRKKETGKIRLKTIENCKRVVVF